MGHCTSIDNSERRESVKNDIHNKQQTNYMASNAISFVSKKEAEICVYGYVRMEIKHYVPNSIKHLLFTFVGDGYELLKFSKTYQSGCFTLAAKDTLAIHKKHNAEHQYILCDVDAVKHGIHCWRVQIGRGSHTNSSACVMWAVSEKCKYQNRSFESAKQVWGGISTGYFVKAGQFTFDNRVRYNGKKTPYCVDMLLDLNKCVFKMGIVDDDSFETIEFNQLPKNFKHGFVPHFNNYLSDGQLRCAKIPTDIFRKKVDFEIFSQPFPFM